MAEQVNLDRVEKILKDWGKDVVAEMISILNSKGAERLQKSIDSETMQDLESVQLVISMDGYGQWADSGRGKGMMPPRKAISEWAERKGIPKQAVWPIMLKIKRGEGTKNSAKDFLRLFYDKFPEIRKEIVKEVSKDFALYFERLVK